jgi:hypothetical protein
VAEGGGPPDLTGASTSVAAGDLVSHTEHAETIKAAIALHFVGS